MTPPNPAWMIIALLTTAAFAGCLSIEPETMGATHTEAEQPHTAQNNAPQNLETLTAIATETTATSTSGVTVTLRVHSQFTELAGLDPGELDALPGTAECELEVASGSDGGDVLDEGVAAGCIAEWSYDDFDGNRFIVSIDNLRAEGLTCLAWEFGICQFWELRVNGGFSEVGIDDYRVGEGDLVEFVHRTITIGE